MMRNSTRNAIATIVVLSLGANVLPRATAETKREESSAALRMEDLSSIDQVTSVSQLSDVQPTDWAFQALQSLVERYGCIAGYPDGTFRGNRAATRYELAAALNACLDQISDRFATKEDLATVKALQEEFKTELAALKGRVDGLEARTKTLEAQQFSTTTKLQGEAIFSAIAAGGGAPGTGDPNPTASYRVRLNLVTSFTGKDTLITGLQSFGYQGGLLGGSGLQNSLFPGSVLNSGSANVSFSPQFAGVDPQNLASNGNNPGNVQLYKLLYVFPVSKQVTAFVFPKAETTDAFPQVIPWESESQGAVSRFAGVNPVVRQSGGTSGVGLATGAGFIWNPSSKVNLTALYGSVSAPISTGDLSTGNPLGSGLFPDDKSSFVAAAQLTLRPTKNFDAAVNFAYAQHNINILGTGLASSGLNGFSGGDVFALPGLDLGQRVQVIGLGGTATYRITPKIALSAYGAGFFVDNVGGGLSFTTGLPTNVNGSAIYTSFMGGIHFSDVFAPGNTAALIFGQPLYAESTGGNALIAPNVPGVFKFARPFHVEAYYRFKVNDNISITPGVFAVFNPESNSENNTAVVGVLRASFKF
jgi:Carbohydrate-selective porin, OprB family/S-layer homology domain